MRIKYVEKKKLTSSHASKLCGALLCKKLLFTALEKSKRFVIRVKELIIDYTRHRDDSENSLLINNRHTLVNSKVETVSLSSTHSIFKYIP